MRIVIIGAGVTGLIAALRLNESNLDSIQEIVVMEKQPRPGGLLQSTIKNGYWWDNGAFVFGRSSYLVKLLPDIFKPVEDRSTKVWLKGKLHTYPIRISDYMMSQSTFTLLTTIINYICSNTIFYFGSSPSNLHDWLRYRMTEKLLSESGLVTYLKKLQGKATTELSPVLGYQRLNYIHNATRPGRLIKAFFKHAYGSSSQQKTTAMYYQCGYGVGSISLRLSELCRTRGIKIIYNTKVQKIEKNKSIANIFYDRNSDNSCRQASYVISTIPLNELVKVLIPQVTEECLSCAKSLAYMDMQLLFFIVNRPVILNQLLILRSHEEHHIWKRLIARSLQNGLSSVLVEITFDPRIGEPKHDIINRVSNDLTAELGLFEQDDILFKHTTVVHKAYPIYEIGFKKKVATIIQEIESAKFLIAGRQGRFLYTGTDGAIQTAISAADKIIHTISTRTTV